MYRHWRKKSLFNTEKDIFVALCVYMSATQNISFLNISKKLTDTGIFFHVQSVVESSERKNFTTDMWRCNTVYQSAIRKIG